MIEYVLIRSKITEISSVATGIDTAFQQSSLTTDTVLVGLITSMNEINNLLIEAIKRIKAKSDLIEYDETRDQCGESLYYFVKGATYSLDPNIAAAAKEIFKVLENFGLKIFNEAYDVESGNIRSMLKDLAAESLQASITTLVGCSDQIAALAAAETQFEEAQVAFKAEKGDEGNYENATELKKEVCAIINNSMVHYLNGMLVANPTAYQWLNDTIATIIADNNVNVRKRSHATTSDKEVA